MLLLYKPHLISTEVGINQRLQQTGGRTKRLPNVFAAPFTAERRSHDSSVKGMWLNSQGSESHGFRYISLWDIQMNCMVV